MRVQEFSRVAQSGIVYVHVRYDNLRVVVDNHVHVAPWRLREEDLQHSNIPFQQIHNVCSVDVTLLVVIALFFECATTCILPLAVCEFQYFTMWVLILFS